MAKRSGVRAALGDKEDVSAVLTVALIVAVGVCLPSIKDVCNAVCCRSSAAP